MNKSNIIEAIIKNLESAHKLALAAAAEARETATHSENVAENRYDTLGLEAAYLAHGQSLRVLDTEQAIEAFKALDQSEQDIEEAVKLGALITLIDPQSAPQSEPHYYLLAPAAGGLVIEEAGAKITTITPSAPLGKLLLNKFRFDEVELQIGRIKHRYEIAAFC